MGTAHPIHEESLTVSDKRAGSFPESKSRINRGCFFACLRIIPAWESQHTRRPDRLPSPEEGKTDREIVVEQRRCGQEMRQVQHRIRVHGTMELENSRMVTTMYVRST